MATVEAAAYIPPSARKPNVPLGPIDDRIHQLRELGMTCGDISIALKVYECWDMSPGQVTYRCQQMGWHRRGRPHARTGLRAAVSSS